jgi:gamma-glutamyltranspeptidase/glutathione hydrolase
MVASTHWLASASGMSVLERGGNAIDAAAAAGFVMQIVEPHLSGPGGELSAVLWSVNDGNASVVCGQGVSPAAATIQHFEALGLDLVPGSGLLAATVPGSFGAWTMMLERWGTWELSDVLSYALRYAESGFPLLATTSAVIDAVRDLFVGHWRPSEQVWLDQGAAPRAGSVWTLAATARTYRRLLDESVGSSREQRIAAARRAFYSGFVADAIDRFSRTEWRDTSGRDRQPALTSQVAIRSSRLDPGGRDPYSLSSCGCSRLSTCWKGTCARATGYI